MAALFGGLYAVLAVSRWVRYGTISWDLGIFVQVVDSYSHLRWPVADLKGSGFAILGDHFSPVLVLLAPFYRLCPTPLTLLVAQSILLGASVWPVTHAAAQLLGRRTGVLIGAGYGMSWGLQRAADFDFHEIAFAVPLIAASLAAALLRRWRSALLWAAPLLLVKEDLGLTCAAIALVVAWRCRERDPGYLLPALATAAVATVCCLLTVTVLIPVFSEGGYDYWAKIGDDSGFMATLTEGGGEKLQTLMWIFLPTSGLLALRSPLLIAALPTLAWRMLSNDEHYWSVDWHYSAVLMPVTALAMTDALTRMRVAHRPLVRAYAHHLPAVVLAVALTLSMHLPFASLADGATYSTDRHAEAGASTLARIPDGASVEVNVIPSAHLTNRCRVYWVGNAHGVIADYIAYYDPKWSGEDMLAYARKLHPDAAYNLVAAKAGFWVVKREPAR
ncbi:DUF2079 domain-containing protein [Streptomyces sp. S3(2020)]|nr:DUF2079 domain-containing protein [Streptomyces sp. S3(2020)]